MNNPNKAIEQVLAGLREVEVPAGIERRVMNAVRERSSARRRWNFARPSMGIRKWTLAMAGVVIAAALVSSLMLRHPHAVTQSARVETPASVRDAAATELHANALPVKAHLLSKSKVERVDDQEALAISEMLAPSKPAPPLPLTHQETLLAEVVHHGEPAELVSLRPDVRARQMEIAKAEFKEFFEPPAVDDQAVKENE